MSISYMNTPGVKIKEVATLPPSVVQVSTAIPVFLGYTVQGPLNQGKRITSLKEYEDEFGGAFQYEPEVTAGEALPDSVGKFFLYEAIRAYFLNGGGPCYIVSVGTAAADKDIEIGDFNNGLAEVAKHDEPTLVVCPEAIGLSTANYGTLAGKMLTLCADMQDRFALLDSPSDLEDLTKDSDLTAYRTALGTNDLSYGAAYYPPLSTVMTYSFGSGTQYTTGTPAQAKTLAALATEGGAAYQEAL
ncbi:MAG: phage tail sheath family protein, partial [Bacteroidota bacterium]